ncbi:4'-phosphopantetheinyl transferase family protein [Candidatus Poriferisocius sp.]|uniref:4'-phosphopantetheinyl transferase family protein n=1 Tax=Candidatus Poriferisocius sp. TaxID=3101276 RepID=UPI003B021E71
MGTSRWWRLFREIDGAAIFSVDLAPHEGHEVEAWGWLDDRERSRHQRAESPDARRRFLLCRAALRAVIHRLTGCANDSLRFTAAEQGKPTAQVDGNPVPLSFSVSHSGRYGLLAVAAGGQLGVDIEDRALRRHDPDAVIRAISSPDEQADFEQLEDDQRFRLLLRLWTFKEAVAKAQGRGIASARALSRFEIPGEVRRGARSSVCRFPQIPDTTWHLEDLSTGEFAAAMAHEVSNGPPMVEGRGYSNGHPGVRGSEL